VPAGYRASTRLARLLSRVLWGDDRYAGNVTGMRGWTRSRDLPLPAPRSFRDRWHTRELGLERW